MTLEWQQSFYNELNDPGQISALFDCLPDLYFYAKNIHSQFTMANAALCQLFDVENSEDLLGKTDHHFFEKSVADLYICEDQKVFSGESIVNRQWMVPDQDGQMNWYQSSKLPLRNKNGDIIGLCGLMRDLKKSGKELKPYYDLSEVIEYINKNFHKPIKMKTLADMLDLSVSQLDRKFKDFTGVTPSNYIVKVRLAAVANALRQTKKSISQLAYDNGFYDHSQLSRYFKTHYGMSPSQYRKLEK